MSSMWGSQTKIRDFERKPHLKVGKTRYGKSGLGESEKP